VLVITFFFLQGEINMRKVSTALFATKIRIVRNTRANSQNSQWARIVEVGSGKTLHTGQIGYIRKVARDRYNVNADL
jgi:RNA polymerase-interacting CarD/CdnL/TRCF family regulator